VRTENDAQANLPKDKLDCTKTEIAQKMITNKKSATQRCGLFENDLFF
jgi:hypothetical protein